MTPLCPCGSGEPFVACCGPLHAGAGPGAGGGALTAEALMRSRFSAFALGDAGYLLRSWHPSTRPASLELDADVEWRRLQIVDTSGGGAGDAEGVVEFRASYRAPGGAGLLHERSRFARDETREGGGRWAYLDGAAR